MIFLPILLFCALVSAQEPTIDPDLLAGIFGTPPTGNPTPTPAPGTPRKGLEEIIVSPTSSPTIISDGSGGSCQCVPYYLCDSELMRINDSSVDGYGQLDIRFGEDDPPPKCQESVEVCCKSPRPPTTQPPQPDPTKLRGCGYSNPKGIGANFITTGQLAQFGEYPWVLAILDPTGVFIGVGVLIHPQVALTAAHIVYRYGPQQLTVRGGEWDTQTVKEIYPHQERVVEDIYYHSGFMNKSLKNDVALLRLESPFHLAEHINVLCLPQQDESFDGSKDCVANGWGKDVFGLKGRYAVILKKVEQDIVPHARCQELMRRTRLGANFKLHSSFICAGGDGRDTCQGDGGGPLACPVGNNRYKLAGLVAWGIGCGQVGVPAVFASVPVFRTWLDAKMNDWGFGTNTYNLD